MLGNDKGKNMPYPFINIRHRLGLAALGLSCYF